MPARNISLDKAELLSVVFESLLYGLSLPLFGRTIWTLSSRRATHQVNRKMLAVACALLVCSTAHFVIRCIRITEGLIQFRNELPGGSIGYFANASQWTFVSKNYVYTVQTLIGDGVLLYRCHVVWQSKLVMIMPVLLWCAVAATGLVAPLAEARGGEVFKGSLSLWITSFWVSTLTTNLFTTLLLAFRIWRVDRKVTSSLGHRTSRLRPILHIILDAGIIYSLTLLAALVCFVNQSNGQYVILDMITPIIAITFYMVIIRVGQASQERHVPNAPAVGYISGEQSVNLGRRSDTQPIALVGNTDRIQLFPMSPGTPAYLETHLGRSSGNNHPSKCTLDVVARAV